MDDKELLELAAKASEIEYPWYKDSFGSGFRIELGGGYARYWNPLRDDGDALRLAVKLKLHVDVNENGCNVFIHNEDLYKKNECGFIEEEGQDIFLATRRAIVRAAAEIGKSQG